MDLDGSKMDSFFAKEKDDTSKWPVELSGEFELAAMIMVSIHLQIMRFTAGKWT